MKSNVAKLVFLALALAGCGSGGDTDGGSSASSTGSGQPQVAAPYTLDALSDVRISSHSEDANYQRADADVDFHDGPFESVTLHVKLTSPCFPFDKWKDDPPPSGQNWPADCDAFDRNFETSLDLPVADAPGVGLELVRAITPFGGPLEITEDITDVANGLPGAHKLSVTIPTYSDGEGKVSGSNGSWNVSVSVDVVPGTAPRNVLAVVPLYYGSNTDPAGPGELAFDAPAGVASGRVDYRATGHGGGAQTAGCIGPAEEFCKRVHHISVDGAEIDTPSPWRIDCKDNCTAATYDGFTQPLSYCAENPCGDKNSVKAPRANWCPGTETPAMSWDVPAVAGPHSFSFAIPNLVVDGGQWRVSATYFAFGP